MSSSITCNKKSAWLPESVMFQMLILALNLDCFKVNAPDTNYRFV